MQLVVQTLIALALAAVPFALAAPEMAPPFPMNSTGSGQKPSNPWDTERLLKNKTQLEILAIVPAATTGFNVPPKTQPTMPTQIKKNCHGSGFCPFVKLSCKNATAKFVSDFVYRNETTYVSTFKFGDRCHATFKCENNNYGTGLWGSQIKEAIGNIWNDGINRDCKKCGSSYMDNGCSVTVNYCKKCVEQNTDLAPQPAVGAAAAAA